MVEEGFEDVLGTGAIRKKILKYSDGKKAEFGDEVTMTYRSYDLETDVMISDDTQVSFRIGDNETFAVLELMGRVMRVGEVVQVHCESRFAYGNVGSEVEAEENQTSKSSIKFIITMDEWISERKMPDEMTNDELIVEANKKKDSGNRWFNDKNYPYAINCYKKALKVLEKWNTEEDFAQNESCKQLVVALGNNVANVQCKLGKYKEAKESCREVLQVDAKNMKAWYRLAQMAYQQGECSEATSYIREALEIDPTNKAIRELVPLVKEKREQQKAKEKQLYGKLGNVSTPEETASPSQPSSETTTAITAPFSDPLRTIFAASVVLVAVIAMIYNHFISP
ncbi:hypothetical protein, variant [Aphanomyces invadans]|uniref:PPIase FKBP-type domain-containing protein n=1 Tax=Aphanomyces invadans TaxID=157072 RepID=A0A024UT34_9STRA|nr:hypothetical protein, variant [Aphanomyces invadans]ETW09494.1 hypothetical protein, variant [Aphanomyces invadans]|eukprot:XP_008860905.1 hypothetical protein, variant [Aphanomyces invadans]